MTENNENSNLTKIVAGLAVGATLLGGGDALAGGKPAENHAPKLCEGAAASMPDQYSVEQGNKRIVQAGPLFCDEDEGDSVTVKAVAPKGLPKGAVKVGSDNAIHFSSKGVEPGDYQVKAQSYDSHNLAGDTMMLNFKVKAKSEPAAQAKEEAPALPAKDEAKPAAEQKAAEPAAALKVKTPEEIAEANAKAAKKAAWKAHKKKLTLAKKYITSKTGDVCSLDDAVLANEDAIIVDMVPEDKKKIVDFFLASVMGQTQKNFLYSGKSTCEDGAALEECTYSFALQQKKHANKDDPKVEFDNWKDGNWAGFANWLRLTDKELTDLIGENWQKWQGVSPKDGSLNIKREGKVEGYCLQSVDDVFYTSNKAVKKGKDVKVPGSLVHKKLSNYFSAYHTFINKGELVTVTGEYLLKAALRNARLLEDLGVEVDGLGLPDYDNGQKPEDTSGVLTPTDKDEEKPPKLDEQKDPEDASGVIDTPKQEEEKPPKQEEEKPPKLDEEKPPKLEDENDPMDSALDEAFGTEPEAPTLYIPRGHGFALGPAGGYMWHSNGESGLLGVELRYDHPKGFVISLAGMSDHGHLDNDIADLEEQISEITGEGTFPANHPANPLGVDIDWQGLTEIEGLEQHQHATLLRLLMGYNFHLKADHYLSLMAGPAVGIVGTEYSSNGMEDETQVRIGNGEWASPGNCEQFGQDHGISGMSCQPGTVVDDSHTEQVVSVGPVVALQYSPSKWFVMGVEGGPMWNVNGDNKGGIGGYVGGSLLLRFDIGGSAESTPTSIEAEIDADANK